MTNIYNIRSISYSSFPRHRVQLVEWGEPESQSERERKRNLYCYIAIKMSVKQKGIGHSQESIPPSKLHKSSLPF